MRVWITSFLVLFGIAELYEWVKHFTLPLPVYILGGAFLAIASNYERRTGFPLQQPDEQPADRNGQIPHGMPPLNPPNYSPLDNNQPAKPISFTIRRSTKQRLED